jgi:hypothetical protein
LFAFAVRVQIYQGAILAEEFEPPVSGSNPILGLLRAHILPFQLPQLLFVSGGIESVSAGALATSVLLRNGIKHSGRMVLQPLKPRPNLSSSQFDCAAATFCVNIGLMIRIANAFKWGGVSQAAAGSTESVMMSLFSPVLVDPYLSAFVGAREFYWQHSRGFKLRWVSIHKNSSCRPL